MRSRTSSRRKGRSSFGCPGPRRSRYGSPSRPWPGRTLSSRFLLPEIRAAYPGMEQRIARTLAQLPAHRLQEGVTSGSLEIMLDGQPIPIRPNMIEFREAIPAGSSAAPWRSGEIVIEWSDPPLPDAGQRPLLSLGADRLVQGIERSLRSRSGQPVPEEVVVWADPKLADEIDRNALRLAEVLGVGRLRVVPSAEGFPASQRRTGRSPEGPRWAYWIPSLRLAERRQKSRVRQRGPRRFEMPPVANEGHDAETDRHGGRAEVQGGRDPLDGRWHRRGPRCPLGGPGQDRVRVGGRPLTR